ncbi:MAG: hypothetical protein RRY29_02470 [Desulfovibrionaceae bacterium]
MPSSTVGLLRGALRILRRCSSVIGAIGWGIACFVGNLDTPSFAAADNSAYAAPIDSSATLTVEKNIFSAVATASLPFGGLIHKDTTYGIIRAAAFLQAARESALSLSGHTAAHIGAFALPRRTALAAAAQEASVSISITDAPAPFIGQELLTVMVKLESPLERLNTRIRETMQHPDTWALYEESLALMHQHVAEGRDLVQRAANLRQDRGAHTDEIFMQRTTYLADQLDALWMYLQLLPHLRNTWEKPADVQGQLQRALTLAPQNPLLWCALGEVQLQLDFPQQAIESLDCAVRYGPEFARALYARGLAHLRMQQSALAESDLSAALALRPHTVTWLRARGAVRMVREDYGPMCEDFTEACAQGDCDGLITARKRDLCQPEPAESAEPATNSPPTTEKTAAPASASELPPAPLEVPHVAP